MVAVVVALGAPGEASADAVGCQRAIARATSKYVQGRAKALSKCEGNKAKGRLRPDDPCTGDPATQRTLDSLWVKLFADVNRGCGGANRDCGDGDDLPLASTGWGGVGTCPDFETSGCTNPIATCTDISTCVQCVADKAVDQAIATYAGAFNTGEFGTSSVANRCQQQINRAASKYIAVRSKVLQKCWDARLRGAHTNPCPDPGDGRAVKALDKAESKKVGTICRACGGPDGACDGVGDLAPADIGFASACLGVSPIAGTSCSGAIVDLSDIVACIDCVADFKTDCADAAAVPQLVSPYPATCNAGGTTTSTSAPTTTSSTLSSTTTVPTTTTTTTSSSTTTTSTSTPSTTTTSTTVATTTTTSTTAATSTTTTTTSSTTTTTVGGSPQFFDFVSTASTAACGVVRRADGVQLGPPLACGSLYLGGGGATVPPNVTPAGATNRFAVTGCTGNTCNLGPFSTVPAVNSAQVDCTATGCNFGTPLPIASGATTTCVVNQFSAPVTATLDVAAGTTNDLDIQLASITYLTANAAQPCPRCQSSPGVPANGTPTAPATGTCDRGARAGLACTSTNPQGLTRDCQPGGTSTNPVRNCTLPCVNANSECACADGSLFIGPLAINLAPLTTGSNARQATIQVGALPNAGFCTGQTVAGCFRSASGYGSTCRRIENNGIPAGSFLPIGTAKPIGFASTFCVPSTGNGLVDFAANLPGPGATTVVGTGRLVP